MPTHHVIGAIN